MTQTEKYERWLENHGWELTTNCAGLHWTATATKGDKTFTSRPTLFLVHAISFVHTQAKWSNAR